MLQRQQLHLSVDAAGVARQAAAAAQQAAGAQPGPDAGANNQQKPNDDGVVDADFKEV